MRARPELPLEDVELPLLDEVLLLPEDVLLPLEVEPLPLDDVPLLLPEDVLPPQPRNAPLTLPEDVLPPQPEPALPLLPEDVLLPLDVELPPAPALIVPLHAASARPRTSRPARRRAPPITA
jgi:hypothetical protein